MRPSLTLLAALAFAWLSAALGGGCYNMRNHETAPYLGDKDGVPLVKHISERIAASDLKIARSLKVSTSYTPPETNELGEWEQVGAHLVPFWPYARGEWSSPEIAQLAPVLERLLAPHFRKESEESRTVLVEAGFSERTSRRYTLTVYGLSIYGGISYLLGYPVNFGTVTLDADLHVLDYLADRQEDVEIYGGTVQGRGTAAHGNFLYFFSYNALTKGALMKGAKPVTWDDLFAEAMIEFVNDTVRALGEAFPMRCARCATDYPTSVAACESCGGKLARRAGTSEAAKKAGAGTGLAPVKASPDDDEEARKED